MFSSRTEVNIFSRTNFSSSLKYSFFSLARTLLELAESRGMTTFVHLVRVAGLEDTFNTFGDYTLFAPSESAFLGKAAFLLPCSSIYGVD